MRIKYCRACDTYTFKEGCPSCGAATMSPCPPKFSPLDKYGKYRRRLKREAWSEV
jgi:H/ACA ribonucleoprotein complex subunit 3